MHIGYHASHEQFSPRDLLRLVVKAEQYGFNHVLSSDHFYPWSNEQGQSGFAWVWLGAALQATKHVEFGVVNAPGQRYHPAIIAQACATLAEMFPKRFWIAVGSGQYLNEHITGNPWPDKHVRDERLKESAFALRDMWQGKIVTQAHTFSIENAKLYTRPQQKPLLIGAALSAEKAKFLASWADGMITVSEKPDVLKSIIRAFREHGGEGKPVYLKVQLSYAPVLTDARTAAYLQWRNNCVAKEALETLRTPEDFDHAGQTITADVVEEKVLISSSLNQFADWFNDYRDMGIEKIFLHNVNRNQDEFIEAFGEHVLPRL